MQEYVVDFSPKLNAELEKMTVKALSLMIEGNFQKAEAAFQEQYELIRKNEEALPRGHRYHKGATLYSWGFALLLQETPQKVSEGYKKILLAYIEDLLDYDAIEQARQAPAHNTLASNPYITVSLLDMVQHQVVGRKASGQIPTNPEDILRPVSSVTKDALGKPIEITLTQVKPAVHAWLKEEGPIEKRVFIGGNYRNIAILRYIGDVVQDFDFVPIMPINLPATSEPSYEKLIHDISMEMLQECSFAIFEVTISDGHLMEIERAKDFTGLRTILVYQTTKHEERPTVTRMLMTTSYLKRGYRNLSELTTIVHDFLSQD